jgi:hypothetical protein
LNKITHFLIIFLFFFIGACNEQSNLSQDKLVVTTIKELNNLILPQTGVDAPLMPFTERYLKNRNALYLAGLKNASSEAQLAEYHYLNIQQRFPERFFVWPTGANVIENKLSNNASEQSSNEIVAWCRYVQSRLTQGINSNIKLNKIEYQSLLEQVAQSIDFVDGLTTEQTTYKLEAVSTALVSLQLYVQQYKPRNMLGLRQLPNGVDWYQSKLNYFFNKTDSPDSWLIKVQKKISLLEQNDKMGKASKASMNTHADFKSLDLYTAKLLHRFRHKIVAGEDWQQYYVNLPQTFSMIKAELIALSDDEKRQLLTVAEVDLGIHYQGWGENQAKTVIQQRLKLNNQQAEKLIKSIIMRPGYIMASVLYIL